MPRLLISVAVALASVVSAASAQTGARRPDSALATLVSRDGAMRLVLTSDALRVGFTALGRRRIRHAADSAFAAHEGRARSGRADAAPAPLNAPERDDDAARPEKPFPLRDVDEIRASGDSLVVCFAARPRASDPCGMWHRFVITGVAPGDAQRFADALRRARGAVVDVPRDILGRQRREPLTARRPC